jgi:hypothetical protein
MYGKSGEKDIPVIDKHLSSLREGAVVVNLGCGPNLQGLNNLASALGRYQYRSTLILADLNTESIDQRSFVPGPEKVEVIKLNAATATASLGTDRANLIFALGLFGDLRRETTPDGTGKAAWPAVLRECFKLLKPRGGLIVSNSCDRQPFEEFRAAVEHAGFSIVHYHASAAAWGSEKSDDWRYLLICEKPSPGGTSMTDPPDFSQN